jgi:hypothetical protein
LRGEEAFELVEAIELVLAIAPPAAAEELCGSDVNARARERRGGRTDLAR